MILHEWPTILRHHADSEPWLENQARTAGRGWTGIERLVGSDAGYWRYQITTMAWAPQQPNLGGEDAHGFGG